MVATTSDRAVGRLEDCLAAARGAETKPPPRQTRTPGIALAAELAGELEPRLATRVRGEIPTQTRRKLAEG